MKKLTFKGNELTRTKVINTLLRYYNRANDNDILTGLNWYVDANKFAQKQSELFNLPVSSICGIISALSVQMNWQQNKVLTQRFLRGDKTGLHYSAQIAKAEKCLQTSDKKEIFNLLTKGGLKTSQFFLNILEPFGVNGVTIDRHALASCLFNPNKVNDYDNGTYTMTAKQYAFFSHCHVMAAEKLNILPHDLQAVNWGVVRDLKNLPNEYKVKEVAPF